MVTKVWSSARQNVVVLNTMLTVPEAARRVGKNPETVRRWIRSGRLRSQRIGTQHVVDEADLKAMVSKAEMAELPAEWATLPSGGPMPDIVSFIHEARRGH